MFLCLNEMTEVAIRVADVPARPYSPDVLAPGWSAAERSTSAHRMAILKT